MDPSGDKTIDVHASSSTDSKNESKHSNKLEENYMKDKDEFVSKNVNVENFIDNEIKNSKIGVSNDNRNNDSSTNKAIKESKINNRRKEEKIKRQSSSKETKQNSGVKRLGSKVGAKVNNSSEQEDTKLSNKLINKEKEDSEKLDSVMNNTKSSAPKSSSETSEKNADFENSVDSSIKSVDKRTKKNENFSSDGWELEDGFEVPDDFSSKPKDEEFEKELFPVLNKLSGLNLNNEENNKEGQSGTSAGNTWGGSWGNWGVTSLLSTATEGVSTLTSHVSAGLNTVFETGLGVPDPESLAQTIEKEKGEKEKNEIKEVEVVAEISKEINNSGSSYTGGVYGIGEGFSQLMSGVSQLSTKVIYEGLDTLETLGKKTMEVLQEGDPGFRKKRALFFQDDDRPVLSQVLREAKEVAEKSDKLEEEKQAARKVHFETLFDDYHGLVHLEALEMLSKQCQLKIHSILLSMSGDALKDLRETLDQVKELCELSDEEDEESDKDDDIDCNSEFSKKISEAVQLMGVKVPYSRLIEVSENVTKWLESESPKNSTPSEIHQKAVSSTAEFTSVSMETFHRMAELLLIKQHYSTADEAESLTQLTGALCARVSRMATKFTMILSENDDSKNNNAIITTIFMESANSSSYIQDACRLLIPVLQVGAST